MGMLSIGKAVVLVISSFFALSQSSFAQDWTAEGTGHFEYQPRVSEQEDLYASLAIGNRVYVYFHHNVDPVSGIGWNEVYLTNGTKNRGFTTCMEAIYSGPGVTVSANYVLGVNDESERRERRDISMSPEAWSRITSYRVRAGWCPSNRIARNVFDVIADGVQVVIDSATWADGTPTAVPQDGSSSPSKVEVFVASAIVPCARSGSTGGVTIFRTARASCEEAMSRVSAEIDNGNACRLYASDAQLNGTPNFSQGCGLQIVAESEAD
jgi:hypothetical protein